MKTQLLIGALLLWLIPSLSAQDLQWGLQVNTHFRAQQDPVSLISFSGFSPSFQLWSGTDLRQQFEWNRLGLSKYETDEVEVRQFTNAWRYELDLLILGKTGKTHLYGGASFLFFQEGWQNQPFVSNEFGASMYEIGLTLSLVPVLVQDLQRGIYLELAFPWEFGSLSVDLQNTQNPAIPARQQSITTLNLDLLARQLPGVRFGLGVRL